MKTAAVQSPGIKESMIYIIRFYALYRVKKVNYLHHKILIVYSLEAFKKWYLLFYYSNGTKKKIIYQYFVVKVIYFFTRYNA